MRTILALLCLALVACGGGGGGGASAPVVPPGPPGPPVVTYTLTVVITGSGTVSPGTVMQVPAGQVKALTATTGAGHIFAGWENTDEESNAAVNHVTMPAHDWTVFCYFQIDPAAG